MRIDVENHTPNEKRVFLRVDFNLPLNKNKILDNFKIKAALPTIRLLLKHKCKIILATHLGRPNGQVVDSLRIKPVAKELEKLLKKKIVILEDCIGQEIRKKIKRSNQQLFMLENLRFYREEERNDLTFAQSLASLAEVYVNEAFGVCHRKHASVHAITKFLPSISGIQLEKEISNLHQALQPKRPSIWIMGGAKLHKIDLLEQALKKADTILLAGALPFAFLRAQGTNVGMSLVDNESILSAKKILKNKLAKKIILPVDYVVADSEKSKTSLNVIEIPTNKMALDIGPATIKFFKQYLRTAKTVVWNGPLGYSESALFSKGTKEIGRYLSKLGSITIAGGGETAAITNKFNIKLSHLSTGGGAALQFLEGKKLPALDALQDSYRRIM